HPLEALLLAKPGLERQLLLLRPSGSHALLLGPSRGETLRLRALRRQALGRRVGDGQPLLLLATRLLAQALLLRTLGGQALLFGALRREALLLRPELLTLRGEPLLLGLELREPHALLPLG